MKQAILKARTRHIARLICLYIVNFIPLQSITHSLPECRNLKMIHTFWMNTSLNKMSSTLIPIMEPWQSASCTFAAVGNVEEGLFYAAIYYLDASRSNQIIGNQKRC